MSIRESSSRATVFFLVLSLAVTYALANVLTVSRVHSGDLIEFEGGWTTRLTGIEAPAIDTPAGKQAHDFTRKQLEGKRVKVFTYTTDNTAAGIVKDAEGRPFARIDFGPELSTDFNALLLEKGLARIDEAYFPADLEHYREIQAEARAKKVGIWSGTEID
jgi:endonuclease YncB( thermonuclease family)